MTTAVGRIVAEVLAEHRIAYMPGDSSSETYVCECGDHYRYGTDHREHVAQVIEERLGVEERVEWGIGFIAGAVRSYVEPVDRSRQLIAEEAVKHMGTPVMRTISTMTLVGEWVKA